MFNISLPNPSVFADEINKLIYNGLNFDKIWTMH